MKILRATKRIAISVLAAALVVGAGQISAQPPQHAKKGPQASVSSATTCALDLDNTDDSGLLFPVLSITTTLTNKSSGTVIPEVRSVDIEGTYKHKDQRGNVNMSLGEVSISDLITLPADVNPDLMITAEFPLCNENGTVTENVLNARELNGKSTVNYGIESGIGETRTIMNRCSDDPDTLDVNEGGIKVDDATIADIEVACAALLPLTQPVTP